MNLNVTTQALKNKKPLNFTTIITTLKILIVVKF